MGFAAGAAYHQEDGIMGLNRCDQMVGVGAGFDNSPPTMFGISLVAGAQQPEAFKQIHVTSDSALVAVQIGGEI